MSLFLVPRRFLESERVQDLVSFMESDVEEFYDMIDYLYDWISVDEADEDYIQDVARFLGSDTLKFKYSEENQAKWLKNYISLIKYLGSSRTINTILMTYSFPVEMKYLWTNDFVTYTEYAITDILYGYGQLKYLSSYLLIRFLMEDTFDATTASGTNYVTSDLNDYTQWDKSWQLRVNEEVVDDGVKGTSLQFRAGELQDRTYIVDTDLVLETQAEYSSLISIYCDEGLEIRFFAFTEEMPYGFPVEIFEEYINLEANPEDMSAWGASGAVGSATNDYVMGHRLSKVTLSASGGFVHDSIVFAGADYLKSYQVIVRKGTDDFAWVEIFDSSSTASMGMVSIEWDAGSGTSLIVASGTGILLDSVWLDDNTVEIYAVTASVTASHDHVVRLKGNTNGSYQYFTAVAAYDKWDSYPFIDGTSPVVNISKTLDLPEMFVFKFKCRPWFRYSRTSYFMTWYIDGTHNFMVFFRSNGAKIEVWYKDGISNRYMQSEQFDDGTSYDDINSNIIICGAIRLDQQTGQRYFVIVEGVKQAEATSFSGIPDTMISSFETLSIGNRNDADQVNSALESLEIWDWDGSDLGTINNEVDFDAAVASLTSLLEYPSRKNLSWGTATASGWTDFSTELLVDAGTYVYGLGWEIKKSSGSAMGASTLLLADPSVTKTADKVLMETELYDNLSADVDRFRMVHQVFNYESQIGLNFNTLPYGWENLFGDVWVWKNSTYMRTTFTMDSGLYLDDLGLTADQTIESVLARFDRVYFGCEAGEVEGSITDVANPIFNKTGVVTVDTSNFIYTLEVYVESESFTFINEVAIRDQYSNVLLYLIHPKIQKTGDKIYWIFKMDFSAE